MEASAKTTDKLEEFRLYQTARSLFDAFWEDADLLRGDVRGRELIRQQVRSLDSICANIEEGYGRGFGKEWAHFLRIARGSARESRGRYERCARLLPPDILAQRAAALNEIIGGLTKTIATAERKLATKR
jgi:four helix bundle protein